MSNDIQWGILEAPNRFHPVRFHSSPMPSGAAPRYKSSGHHTAGFETADEAQTEIDKIIVKAGGADSGRRYEWDGEGTPAMIDFF